MSTIVTRAGKGSPLTHNEVDANFTNLNTDKYQSGDAVTFASAVVIGSATINGTSIPNNKTLVVTTDIGTSVQAYDAQLADIAGLTPTDNNFIVGNGTNFVTESGSTARTSLGLGSIATQDANNVSITGGSVSGINDLAVADGGTGSSTASGARTNLGLAIGTDVQAYNANLQGASQGGINGMKNRIINGGMQINQRGFGATPANFDYLTDRFQFRATQSSKFTSSQSSTAPTGFINSLLFTSSAATTPGSTDQFGVRQFIEGLNISDLAWGTASAKAVTLSFWVRSSLTGTHSGALGNSGDARAYPFSYTISVADTWEYKTITIAGDTSGTWLTTNGIGIKVSFNLGAGSSMLASAGAWTTGEIVGATGSVNVCATNGATFYITGVQLEVGSTATSFDYRPYGTELALCQRYCINYKASDAGNYMRFGSGYANSATNLEINVHFPVTMRTSPSLTVTSTASNYGNYVAGSVNACSSVPVIDTTHSDNPSVSTVNATSTGSFSSSAGGTILSNNNTTAYMLFTAEL